MMTSGTASPPLVTRRGGVPKSEYGCHKLVRRALLLGSACGMLLSSVGAQEPLVGGVGAFVFLFGTYIVFLISCLTQLALTVVGGTGLVGLAVGIGYDDSINDAQEIALKVLTDHPAVLNHPEPLGWRKVWEKRQSTCESTFGSMAANKVG